MHWRVPVQGQSAELMKSSSDKEEPNNPGIQLFVLQKKIVIGLSWPLFNGCNINDQTLSKRQRWSNFKLISWHCVRNSQVVDNYLHWKMWQVNVTFHCNKNFNWPLKFIKIFSWLIYFLIIFSHGLTLCVQNTFGCVDEIRGNVSTVKLHSLNQL